MGHFFNSCFFFLLKSGKTRRRQANNLLMVLKFDIFIIVVIINVPKTESCRRLQRIIIKKTIRSHIQRSIIHICQSLLSLCTHDNKNKVQYVAAIGIVSHLRPYRIKSAIITERYWFDPSYFYQNENQNYPHKTVENPQ